MQNQSLNSDLSDSMSPLLCGPCHPSGLSGQLFQLSRKQWSVAAAPSGSESSSLHGAVSEDITR